MDLYLVNIGQEVPAYRAKVWRNLARLDTDPNFVQPLNDLSRFLVTTRATKLRKRNEPILS